VQPAEYESPEQLASERCGNRVLPDSHEYEQHDKRKHEARDNGVSQIGQQIGHGVFLPSAGQGLAVPRMQPPTTQLPEVKQYTLPASQSWGLSLTP
jgi:hypothetical protein